MIYNNNVYAAHVLAWILLLSMNAYAATPPPVALSDVYHGNVDLSKYWVSEKFDGVRGYWDGERLLTRGGNAVNVPDWFTRNWPKTAMDGELWAGYGKFSTASTIVRTANADDPAWQGISYRVFDLPEHGGNFDDRIPAIRNTVATIAAAWVVVVRQYKVKSETELQTSLQEVLAKGGEGLILHRGSAAYKAGRNSGLLKVKLYEDAEARVTGINPGQGRLEGLMGSINVQTPGGQTFAIGSGFTDKQRANPPAVDSWITYRFNGRTANGLPRFARFLRLRPGGPPPEVTAPK